MTGAVIPPCSCSGRRLTAPERILRSFCAGLRPARHRAFTARAGEDADRYWSRATGGALAPKRSEAPAKGGHHNRIPLVLSPAPTAANQVAGPNRRSTSVATLTGRTARSTLPPCDTPGVATASPGSPDDLSRSAAEAAWHAVTPSIAGTPHVRISKDGGRTYPARHARPLPADPPGQPCTVPVYDSGSATGRMLALDLDLARVHQLVDINSASDVGHQATELGQLLERMRSGRCCERPPWPVTVAQTAKPRSTCVNRVVSGRVNAKGAL